MTALVVRRIQVGGYLPDMVCGGEEKVASYIDMLTGAPLGSTHGRGHSMPSTKAKPAKSKRGVRIYNM